VKHLLTSLEYTYLHATSIVMEQNWADISSLTSENIGVKFNSMADICFVNKINKIIVCIIANSTNWYF